MPHIGFRALHFSLLSILLTVSGVAAAQSPAPKSAPTLFTDNGAPIRLVFPDGREAEARRDIGATNVLKVPFEVYQSTCGKVQRAKCDYEVSTENHRFHFVWTKHPDGMKIGSELRQNFGAGNPQKLEFHFTVGSLSKYAMPEMAKGISDQLISCGTYAFFGREVPVGSVLDVDLWTVERAAPNPETGQTENRSELSYNGVKFESMPEGLRLRSFEESQGNFQVPYLFLDDAASLTLTTPGGDVCQVGMKGSLSAAKPGKDPNARPERKALPVIYDAEAARLTYFGSMLLWEYVRQNLSYAGEFL